MYCGKNQTYCDARNLNIILTLGTSVASVVTNPTVNTGLQQANNIVSQIAGHKICSV